MKRNVPTKRHERGQALILIVFAIIGLLGMTGLTVDGGLAYSDRRHAQNAADTAALAAARAKLRSEPWKGAGLALAGENGYVDQDATSASTDTNVNVEVYGCDEPAATCVGVPVGEEDEYIQVKITSVVGTTFGRIVGIDQITNRVFAIAKAKPGTVDPTMFGNAIISLMCGCFGDDGWNHVPFDIGGNSINIVSGSGVFVNSSCTTGQGAFDQDGGATLQSDAGVCVVGSASYASGTISPPPQTGCGTPYDCPPPVVFPNPSCDTDGDGVKDPDEMGSIVSVGDPNDKIYTSTPGYYTGNKDFPDATPSGKLIMQMGIYCIEDADFSLNATWEITSDTNGNGQHDTYTEGVLIMTVDGGISFNGGSNIKLHAIDSPNAPEDLRNLLLYIPPGNTNPLSVNGNNGSSYTGSIWAPSSHCTLAGSEASLGLNSQIMCYSISTAGSAQLNITYNASENHVITVPPLIELNK